MRRPSSDGRALLRVAVTMTALAATCSAVVLVRTGTTPAAASAAAQLDRGAGPARDTRPDRGAPDHPVDDRTEAVRSAADATRVRAAAALAAERDRVAAALRAEQDRKDRAAAAARAARSAVLDPRGAARLLLADRGWSGQFGCLDALWTKESGWNYRARNASSGATGIPQALPGGKMSSAGADWATNPVTQIRWGLGYIGDVYGSPCAAWAHSRAVNWY